MSGGQGLSIASLSIASGKSMEVFAPRCMLSVPLCHESFLECFLDKLVETLSCTSDIIANVSRDSREIRRLNLPDKCLQGSGKSSNDFWSSRRNSLGLDSSRSALPVCPSDLYLVPRRTPFWFNSHPLLCDSRCHSAFSKPLVHSGNSTPVCSVR
jgi:hypothetical protein